MLLQIKDPNMYHGYILPRGKHLCGSKASLYLGGNTSRNTRWLCSISNLSWNSNKEKQNCYAKRSRHTLFTKFL